MSSVCISFRAWFFQRPYMKSGYTYMVIEHLYVRLVELFVQRRIQRHIYVMKRIAYTNKHIQEMWNSVSIISSLTKCTTRPQPTAQQCSQY